MLGDMLIAAISGILIGMILEFLKDQNENK